MCVSRNHMLDIYIYLFIHITYIYIYLNIYIYINIYIRFGNHVFWETPFFSLTYFSTGEKLEKPNTLTWGNMAATFQKIS